MNFIFISDPREDQTRENMKHRIHFEATSALYKHELETPNFKARQAQTLLSPRHSVSTQVLLEILTRVSFMGSSYFPSTKIQTQLVNEIDSAFDS